MTITTTQSSVTYTGNSATTVFPFSFLIPTDADLTVILQTGAVSGALAKSLYSSTGLGNTSGGSVTYNPNGVPLPIGSTLTIQRDVPLEQETSLVNQGAYYPNVVEGALDYSMMVNQQQQAAIDRALLANPADSVALAPLPPAASRANMLLGFDTTGQPFLYPPIAGSFTPGGVVAITGGNIDGTVIGGTIPAAGSFSTLNGVSLVWTAASTFTLAYSFSILGGPVIITGSGNANTLTFPQLSDTLVSRNSVDTLTNKTIQSDTVVGTKIGTAASQLLSLWGVAPVAQQATTGTVTGFTAGSGTATKVDSTYTGNTGSAAYTVSDVVLALKKLGVLAS